MCCGSWGCRVRHNWATELNWTVLTPVLGCWCYFPPLLASYVALQSSWENRPPRKCESWLSFSLFHQDILWKKKPELIFYFPWNDALSSQVSCLSYSFSMQYILWSWKWCLKCDIIWAYANNIKGIKYAFLPLHCMLSREKCSFKEGATAKMK